MGHYRNRHYYRGKKDAELQPFEDGANLALTLFITGFCALIVGIAQLGIGLYQFVTSDDKHV